jgi:hypothetical protein
MSVRVSTHSGRPPDGTRHRLADTDRRQLRAHHLFDWRVEHAGIAERGVHHRQLVDGAGDLGDGEWRLVLAHRQLRDTVRAHHGDGVAHEHAGVDVEQLGHLAARRQHVADAQVALLQEPEVGHPLIVEDARQVAATGVGIEDDDDVVGRRSTGDAQRGGHGHPTRAADQDALVARQPPRHQEALFVADGDDVV